MDKDLIGQRLRQLRLERGLKQADVARQLAISPAYLNLIEKGKRSVQFPLLWKALQFYGQELEAFMGSLGEQRPDDALAKLLDDPLAATLDLSEDDISALEAEPKAATTIAALFHLYKNTRAQLDTAMAKLSAGDVPRMDYAPSDEVRDFLETHRNYFPELEEEAERLRVDAKLGRRLLSDQLAEMVARHFDFKVEYSSRSEGSSVVRKVDLERRIITIFPGLSEQALKFQLATVAGSHPHRVRLRLLRPDHAHIRVPKEPRVPDLGAQLVRAEVRPHANSGRLELADDLLRLVVRASVGLSQAGPPPVVARGRDLEDLMSGRA